jgi:hypothetical protein
VSYRYKLSKIETKPREVRDEVEVLDPRFALDILADAFLSRLKLTNRMNVTLSIPLYYDPDRNLFAIPERAQPTQSFMYGRYYGASLPSEASTGDYELAVDPSHRLYVRLDETLKPGDAEIFTTTPLGANAAYYGPSRDFLNSRLTTMGVMGYANQASATNGVYIQLSNDNANWDYTGATATLSAAGAVALAQVVAARYARVVWVNGATAQTAFRLGGRYMIAGSELPALSLTPPLKIDPICSVCNKDLAETSDFFVEDNKVYCAKCYSNKRWNEVNDKREWINSLKAWLKHAQAEELKRAKQHTPDAATW